jgi:DNA-binding transcriptional LysR family regulator
MGAAYRRCSRISRKTVVRLQQQLDLNDVAVFAEVAESGSFTVAARVLGLPRATVSRTVARLEAALGAQLLYRTTRRVALTEIGRRFHETGSRGLALIAEARAEVVAVAAEPKGLLRVSAPINFATLMLIPALPEFLAAHPKVRVALRLSDAPLDPLETRSDLAILTGRQPDSRHVTRRLGTSSLVLVASPDYLRGRPAPHDLSDLVHHDFVLFASERGVERWTLDGPDGPAELEVRGRLSVVGPHAELSAALAGLGIALLPDVVTRRYVGAGSLERILPAYGREGGVINAVFPANRHRQPALRAFLDFLVARMNASGGPSADSSARVV